MDFGFEVFQFNRICDCEHELQDLMVSVSLILIRTAVAPSFIESPAAIISNHVISILGALHIWPYILQWRHFIGFHSYSTCILTTTS